MKFWHGTTMGKWSSIRETGLVPRYGYDSSQFIEPSSELISSNGQRLRAVYLHSSLKVAIEDFDINEEIFCKGKSRDHSIVLEISLPDTAESHRKLGYTDEGEVIYKGRIPSRYIRRVK